MTSLSIKREIINHSIVTLRDITYTFLIFLYFLYQSAPTIACNYNRYHYHLQPIETDQVQLSPPARQNCFSHSADLKLMFKYWMASIRDFLKLHVLNMIERFLIVSWECLELYRKLFNIPYWPEWNISDALLYHLPGVHRRK